MKPTNGADSSLSAGQVVQLSTQTSTGHDSLSNTNIFAAKAQVGAPSTGTPQQNHQMFARQAPHGSYIAMNQQMVYQMHAGNGANG